MNYNPILLLLFFEIISDLANQISFRITSVPFLYTPILFLCACPYILTPQGFPSSSGVFPDSALDSCTSRVPLYYRIVFGNHDLGVGCAHNYWDIILTVPYQ